MRVMVLVKATKDSEAGIMPSTELLEAMGKRVAFDGPSRTVIDGPFAETKELVAGFWLWEHGRSGRVGKALPQPNARTERDRNPDR